MKSKPFFAWFLLIVLSIIWGTSFILIKKGLLFYSAGEVGALRIIFAGVFLLPPALKKCKALTKRQWYLLFIAGLVGSFFPAFLFATAQTQINSSLAGMLNALTPIFALLIGFVFFKAKIGQRTLIGLILGFLGTAYLMTLKDGSAFSSINYYALYVVVATVMYGSNINLIKYYLSDLNAITITSISIGLVALPSSIYLFGFTDFAHNLQTPGALTSLGYLAILGIAGTAIALVLFNKLIQITNPVFSSSVTYLIPIIALVWGVVDGELISVNHFIGMAVIIVGVFLANKK